MYDLQVGEKIHQWCSDLWPICRSLSGSGVRETLDYLKKEIPAMTIHEIKSGIPCFDWIVPEEWNIHEAYVVDPAGEKIIDFKKNNLHVVSYSTPIEAEFSLEELNKHLHSLPDQPEAIPYVTSYYKKNWGFCLSHKMREELKPGVYKVVIKSELKPGVLNFGEVKIQGSSEQEIFLSTYVCHPSMANNELSGPTVTTALLQWLQSLPHLKYSYRAIFIPETIGSIAYLSQNLHELQNKVAAGFVVTCVGDNRSYSYMPSRNGGTLADRAALSALRRQNCDFKHYSFLERGSDERQYCSPGVDLPVCSVMRSKYGEYPEYHTSLDDLNLVTPQGLAGGFGVLKNAIRVLECNGYPKMKVLCEPQLGKRGLYPNTSIKGSSNEMRTMLNLIAYSDGRRDLIEIADLIGADVLNLFSIVEKLQAQDLLSYTVAPVGG